MPLGYGEALRLRSFRNVAWSAGVAGCFVSARPPTRSAPTVGERSSTTSAEAAHPRRHPGGTSMTDLRYKLLGRSGLRVSELCLGTMTFGEDWGWGASPDESRKMYDAFRDLGGNFIDTANLYTNGTSEKLLGDFLKGHRESVVLATKYTNSAPGKDPNAGGNQRKNMVQACEASLKRLKT